MIKEDSKGVILVNVSVFSVDVVSLACRLFSENYSFTFGDIIDSIIHVNYCLINRSESIADFEKEFNDALLDQSVRAIVDAKCGGIRDLIVKEAFSHF